MGKRKRRPSHPRQGHGDKSSAAVETEDGGEGTVEPTAARPEPQMPRGAQGHGRGRGYRGSSAQSGDGRRDRGRGGKGGGNRSGGRGYSSHTSWRIADDEPGETETWLERVAKQVEFYFSDSNLRRDTYLQKKIRDGNGYVKLSTILNFNRIRGLRCRYAAQLAQALRKSDVLELSEDRSMVRRNFNKLPAEELCHESVEARTVYVEGLPLVFGIDPLTHFFARYGQVRLIDIPRHRETKEFRGFCFVEFGSAEQASSAIAALNGCWPSSWPPRFDGRNLTAMLKKKWQEYEQEYRQLRRGHPPAVITSNQPMPAASSNSVGVGPGEALPDRAKVPTASTDAAATATDLEDSQVSTGPTIPDEPGSEAPTIPGEPFAEVRSTEKNSESQAEPEASSRAAEPAISSAMEPAVRPNVQVSAPVAEAKPQDEAAACPGPSVPAGQTAAAPSCLPSFLLRGGSTKQRPSAEPHRPSVETRSKNGEGNPRLLRNCLLHISGFALPQTAVTIRQFAEHAVSVVYADFPDAQKAEAYLRLKCMEDSLFLLKDLKITKRMLGWLRPIVRLMDEAEEKAYWDKVDEKRQKRASQANVASKVQAQSGAAPALANPGTPDTPALRPASNAATPSVGAATPPLGPVQAIAPVAESARSAGEAAPDPAPDIAPDSKPDLGPDAAPDLTPAASLQVGVAPEALEPRSQRRLRDPRSRLEATGKDEDPPVPRSKKAQKRLAASLKQASGTGPVRLHGMVHKGERWTTQLRHFPTGLFFNRERRKRRPRYSGFVDTVAGNSCFTGAGFGGTRKTRRRKGKRPQADRGVDRDRERPRHRDRDGAAASSIGPSAALRAAAAPISEVGEAPAKRQRSEGRCSRHGSPYNGPSQGPNRAHVSGAKAKRRAGPPPLAPRTPVAVRPKTPHNRGSGGAGSSGAGLPPPSPSAQQMPPSPRSQTQSRYTGGGTGNPKEQMPPPSPVSKPNSQPGGPKGIPKDPKEKEKMPPPSPVAKPPLSSGAAKGSVASTQVDTDIEIPKDSMLDVAADILGFMDD